MSYLLIEESFATNDKIRGLSDKAYRLHVNALLLCATHLTDGAISTLDLRLAGANAGLARPKSVVPQLETAGLWHANGNGWKIHDYLDYNLSRKEVSRKRKLARDRKKRARLKASHAGQDAGQDAAVTQHKTPVKVSASKEARHHRDTRHKADASAVSRKSTMAKARRIARGWKQGGTDAFHDRLDELQRETGYILTDLERDQLIDVIVEVQSKSRQQAPA